MKKLGFCVAALAFLGAILTPVRAGEVAIFTGKVGWISKAAADAQAQITVNKLTAWGIPVTWYAASADPDYMIKRLILPGDVPSPANPPSGCKFHPRCRYAKEVCSQEVPEWREVSHDHWVACHLSDKLALAGIAKG